MLWFLSQLPHVCMRAPISLEATCSSQYTHSLTHTHTHTLTHTLTHIRKQTNTHSLTHSSLPLPSSGFANPNIMSPGRVAVANKGVGQHGFVAEMVRLGLVYDDGNSLTQPSACMLATSQINCSGGTFNGTRYVYDVATRACVAAHNAIGCAEVRNGFSTCHV